MRVAASTSRPATESDVVPAPWAGRDLDFSEAPIARFAALSNAERGRMFRESYAAGRRTKNNERKEK